MIDPEQTTTHVIPGPPKSLEFLPAGEAGDIEDLVALLAEEMTQAWRHGKRLCGRRFSRPAPKFVEPARRRHGPPLRRDLPTAGI